MNRDEILKTNHHIWKKMVSSFLVGIIRLITALPGLAMNGKMWFRIMPWWWTKAILMSLTSEFRWTAARFCCVTEKYPPTSTLWRKRDLLLSKWLSRPTRRQCARKEISATRRKKQKCCPFPFCLRQESYEREKIAIDKYPASGLLFTECFLRAMVLRLTTKMKCYEYKS